MERETKTTLKGAKLRVKCVTGAPTFKRHYLAGKTMSTSKVDVTGHGAGFYFLGVPVYDIIYIIARFISSSWVLLRGG